MDFFVKKFVSKNKPGGFAGLQLNWAYFTLFLKRASGNERRYSAENNRF
jgi:hypothetical protein